MPAGVVVLGGIVVAVVVVAVDIDVDIVRIVFVLFVVSACC